MAADERSLFGSAARTVRRSSSMLMIVVVEEDDNIQWSPKNKAVNNTN